MGGRYWWCCGCGNYVSKNRFECNRCWHEICNRPKGCRWGVNKPQGHPVGELSNDMECFELGENLFELEYAHPFIDIIMPSHVANFLVAIK